MVVGHVDRLVRSRQVDEEHAMRHLTDGHVAVAAALALGDGTAEDGIVRRQAPRRAEVRRAEEVAEAGIADAERPA